MHPLDGPRLKIARAKAEIDQLRSMESVFFEHTHHTAVRAEQNLKSGKYIYRIKIDGPPPSLDWGVYIGEITHNLRSALNYLVYQLALLNGSNKLTSVAQDKRLQFPIFLKSKEFRAKGKNMIKLLRPEHKARIERLQPYKRSDGMLLKSVNLAEWCGRNSPLFWLEEINNADKHRIIQVTGVKPGGFVISYWGERPEPPFKGTRQVFRILRDGAKFGEADPDVHVNTQIRTFIAFADSCEAVRNQPVCPLLDKIWITVSEIIDSFVSEF